MASTWQRLAYVTNGTSNVHTFDTANDSSFSGNDFAVKKHLRILIQMRASNTGSNLVGRFGNSSGIDSQTYKWKYNSNGGADGNLDGDDFARVGGHSYQTDGLFIVDIPANIDGEDKLCFSHWVQGGASRVEISFRSQISAPITRIQISLEFGSINFGSYSSILVLGADDQGTTPVYPNLTNGTLFEESDTGKIYMFDGTSAWNEIT